MDNNNKELIQQTARDLFRAISIDPTLERSIHSRDVRQIGNVMEAEVQRQTNDPTFDISE